ncbi:helix-turn-helix domain-containing protein [Streptacidiphilus sp. MAP12-20]|uniref:helix-turn-helix domain-containing protein n=1 Tax=Streptacidiphilus sp. MAP12-20 TaxID=3156299 RepID=UPI003515AA03
MRPARGSARSACPIATAAGYSPCMSLARQNRCCLWMLGWWDDSEKWGSSERRTGECRELACGFWVRGRIGRMKWNLRALAVNQDVWQAELRRRLAEHGLVISVGKMSNLWTGQPVSLKLEELDIICVVLGCAIGELLEPEPEKVTCPMEKSAPPAVDLIDTGAANQSLAPFRGAFRPVPGHPGMFDLRGTTAEQPCS